MTFKRSYEVSVWTLQDEFISILKASNIENKGQIEKPEFHLVDDGTEEFNFSIPMYLYDGKNRIVNPLWESVENGIIIQDMRKIKVTYNKNTSDEKTFEFMITELEERHASDQLYCDVTCSGLAFHELGKIGYKIAMGSDDINNDDYDYFIGKTNIRPRATLNYWMNKILPYLPNDENEVDPSQWYYKIEMDWSAFTEGRQNNKIYEDSYVKSWTIFEDRYIANEVSTVTEKERIPDIKESNIYNITQDLAKLFGVFCRYEYSHDQNLNITKRVIVFYNNYMREKEGYIDLTYPYSTSEITRNRNSNDLSTKMYIRPVDDEMSSSGQITILNVPANKMKEDYILNFDYLIKLGNISSDQQEAIKEFEVKIGKYNKALQEIENPLMIAQNELNKIQANITLYTNAIALDKEQISSSNDLLNELTDNTGILEVTNKNPRTAVLLKQKDSEKYYYINLTDKGIIPETIKIYRTYDFTNLGLTNSVEYGKVVYDEFNNVNKIEQITNNEEKNIVYLTYKYKPQLYYDNIRIVWENRLSQDEQNLATAKSRLATIQLQIDHLTNLYQTNLDNKNKTCKAFERLMGPALRESQWQPEDYTDYGHNYIDNFSINYTNNYIQKGKSGLTKFLWDKKPFSDELGKTGYKTGINLDWCGYPVIDLSGHEEYIKKYYDKLSFMFYDFLSDESLDDPTAKTIKNMKIFSVPATAQYGFVNYNGIRPVLILTGFEKLSDNSRKKVSNSKYNPIVGVITTRVEGSSVITSIQHGFWTPTFLNDLGNGKFEAMEVYYPRIEISTLDIKIDDYLLGITYNNQLLKNYEDYYLLIRDNSEWENDALVTSNSAYYATLKPSAIMQYGFTDGLINFKFNVSNADVAIYLDAIKILKENSQPKVSYTIQPSVLDQEFLYTLYNKLCRICNINDYELKFENVQGYISSLTINCDNPNEDSIEIKNYKSKFEDIFSTIVAQTVSMQKNAYALDVISGAFNSGGIISQNTLQSSIDASDLNFNFNKNNLTIDEENGIQCLSDGGVVSIRNDGIFVSTKKNSDDNWQWNSVVLPKGISADSITTGHIDTNQVKIYAGDKIRFQLNENGLFAYKSFFEDLANDLVAGENEKITNSPTRINDIDSSQYIVMNENGLFLWGKKDALILNKEKTGYIDPLSQDVARVEVSWDGFKLRNWKNEEVFYADPDTGNLNITGKIYATGGEFYGDVYAKSFQILTNSSSQESETEYKEFDTYINDKIEDQISTYDLATVYELWISDYIVKKNGSTYTPSSVTLSAKKKVGSGNYENFNAYFKVKGQQQYLNEAAASSEYIATLNSGSNYITYELYDTSGNLLDSQSIGIVEDGQDGQDGTSPYNLIVTNENFTFPEGIVTSATSEIYVYKGTDQQVLSFNADNIEINPASAENSLTVTAAYGTGYKSINVTITSTSQLTNGGEIAIPVTADNQSFNAHLTYSVAQKGDTGDTIIEAQHLYYLKTNNNSVSPPNAPVSSSSNQGNQWSLTIPEYNGSGTYYTCEQYKWKNGGYTWTVPAADLTINTALSAANTIHTFTDNGLIAGYRYNNETYSLALTSEHSLLIGANSGIVMAGSSISMQTINNSGGNISLTGGKIELDGGSIDLKTNSTKIQLGNEKISMGTLNNNNEYNEKLGISSDGISLDGGSIDLKTGTTKIQLGNEKISMGTLNGNNYDENLGISSDSIELTIDADLSLLIEKDAIHFRKKVAQEEGQPQQEEQQEGQGEQQQEGQEEQHTPIDPGQVDKYVDLFSVDKNGILTCQSIICTGDIIGYMPSSTPQEETTPGGEPTISYTLFYDGQAGNTYAGRSGQTVYGLVKTANFKTNNNVSIEAGEYEVEIDWGLERTNDGSMTMQGIACSIDGTIIFSANRPTPSGSRWAINNELLEKPIIEIATAKSDGKLQIKTQLQYECGNGNLFGTYFSIPGEIKLTKTSTT